MKLDTLPSQAIKEFNSIYTKLYKEQLSNSELISRANNFLELYYTLVTNNQMVDYHV